MDLKEKIEQFKKYQRRLRAYDHAVNMLTYDAATGMPPGASETLGDTLGILSEETYDLTVNEDSQKLLKGLMTRKDELDFQTRRETEELFEEQEKMLKVPKKEIAEEQIAANESGNYWQKAKKSNDYTVFQPYLGKIIKMKKRYAGHVKSEKQDIYEALLDEYEKGWTIEKLDKFFDGLKTNLEPLIEKIQQSGKKPRTDFLKQKFDLSKQKELSAYVMEIMGADKDRCTLKESAHPFTTDFSKNDVRITTRYNENDLTSNLYSVIHECGHGLYELNVGDDLLHSALGHGATTAIHESQSRLWENNIGRSLPFCQLIFPKIQELFPEQMKNVTAEEFYRGVNVARPSLIRTEADELTYSLHIIVRYEMEKKILHDEAELDELPEKWNKLYKEYLGVDVPDDAQGILQDTHWADGSFGYFPSYAIGNAYAAQIFHFLKKDVDIEACCRKADLSPILRWLTEKVYRHGMLLTAEQILENACHEKFDPQYYIDYLTDKYTKLYEL